MAGFDSVFCSKSKFRKKVEGCKFTKPSLTEQQHVPLCDINNKVKQVTMPFLRDKFSGDKMLQFLNDVDHNAQLYMDCTKVPDLAHMQETIDTIQEFFVQNVPAAIRQKFDNNFSEFYKYAKQDKDALKNMFAAINSLPVPTAQQLQDVQAHPSAPAQAPASNVPSSSDSGKKQA